MKLKISPKIVDSYPDLRIGVVAGKDLANSSCDEKLEQMKRNVETGTRGKYTREKLVNHPFIWAWRKTYSSFGVKPKKYKPTAEALIRRVLDGERIPRINTIVDTYLLVETETFLPCGGYDLDKIKGDIVLRVSQGGEEFHPLGSSEVEETKLGEVVYCDDEEILTRKWNYRDCDFAKITTTSKRVALFSEAAQKEIPTDALEGFISRLSDLLREFCGGSVKSFIADVKEKSDWEIPL